ncbi:MAG: hypothetical protein LKI34_02830 [Bifidobacterium tibiigranuli]|jgi:hypothetical protein|uniref:phage tail tube protein n=1 Tax=Bifidobacterium tibiigranuli TaxID=2172043 RepID=UPI0026EE9C82|nr:hypothetical protein [Bifidobacterium tibiigranuli]MCI1673141.1 hypothetical protein [Bifidobacterium tibiigranuli]MCI1713614.1 hypothetical protein [Bifidobacterium tibiigranuli]
MSDKNNVIVGSVTAIGGVSLAPTGSKLPTDCTTALDPAFGRAGYVTSDGFDREEKIDTDTVIALGGDAVHVVKKGTSATVSYGFLEYLNPIVQKALYGANNVTSTPANATHGNQLAIAGVLDLQDPQAMVIDLVDGAKTGRLVFGSAQLTDRDKYTMKDDDAASRTVTWALLPMGTDSNGKSIYFREYWDDGKKATA